MSNKLTIALVTMLWLNTLAAHDEDQSKQTRAGNAQAILHIAANAKEALATVERFSAAISAGELVKASGELDADVIVLESGGSERSRAQYLAEHAQADADFLKHATVTLKNRSAFASAELAWVASVSEIQTTKGDKMLTILSTETMVLKKAGSTWKIVHIHWSSRAKK
jgi:ketosteroid isomerase-like protein